MQQQYGSAAGSSRPGSMSLTGNRAKGGLSNVDSGAPGQSRSSTAIRPGMFSRSLSDKSLASQPSSSQSSSSSPRSIFGSRPTSPSSPLASSSPSVFSRSGSWTSLFRGSSPPPMNADGRQGYYIPGNPGYQNGTPMGYSQNPAYMNPYGNSNGGVYASPHTGSVPPPAGYGYGYGATAAGPQMYGQPMLYPDQMGGGDQYAQQQGNMGWVGPHSHAYANNPFGVPGSGGGIPQGAAGWVTPGAYGGLQNQSNASPSPSPLSPSYVASPPGWPTPPTSTGLDSPYGSYDVGLSNPMSIRNNPLDLKDPNLMLIKEALSITTAGQAANFLAAGKNIKSVTVAIAILETLSRLCKSPINKGALSRTAIVTQIQDILFTWAPQSSDVVSSVVGSTVGVGVALMGGLTTVATLGFVDLNSVLTSQNLTIPERFAYNIFDVIACLCEGDGFNQSNFTTLGEPFFNRFMSLVKLYVYNVAICGQALRAMRHVCRQINPTTGIETCNTLVCEMVGKLDACETTILILTRHGAMNGFIAEQGLHVLGGLLDSNGSFCANHRIRIANLYDGCGVIARLVKQHGLSNPQVVMAGMMAIRGAAWQNDANVAKLGTAGACETVCELMSKWSNHHVVIAHNLLLALEALAQDDYNKLRFCNSGACEMILHILETYASVYATHIGVATSSTMTLNLLSTNVTAKSRLRMLNAGVHMQRLIVDNPNVKDESIKQIGRMLSREFMGTLPSSR